VKFSRFDYTVWAVLGTFTLALAGLFALSRLAGVRVLATSPTHGGQGAALGPIEASFDISMQQESIRFELEPPIAGLLSVIGVQARFMPAEPLEPGVTYTAKIAAGAVSTAGRVLRSDVVWSFTVRQPGLVYIAPATSGPPEIWRVNLDGNNATVLTETGGRVFDFSLSGDGQRLVYSAINQQDGIDLWLMDLPIASAEATLPPRLLVDCGRDRCTVPAWAPDGARIAFSREETGLAPDAPPGPPRVWTVNVDTGEAAALYVDSQVLGYGPTWSPDGKRLAFYDGSVSGIRVVEIATYEEMVLPTRMGLVGTFAPDGQQMLFNDVSVSENLVNSILYLADFNTRAVSEPFAADAPWSDYGVPAWSPNGEWLAVSLRDQTNTPGKQLWLMRPDGSEARAITRDPGFTHGGYRWDPWSRRLVIQQVALGTPFPKPELVVWNLDTGQSQVVAVDATLAEWQP
jgi:TolB protein